MTRRGFALLAVLWTLVAVAAVSGVAIAAARIGSLVTRNRVLLTRAAWAREACAEILLARYAQGQNRGLDPVDLGRGAWCDAALEDPASKLNVNLADSAALETVLRLVVRDGNLDSLTDALLTRRRRVALAFRESCRRSSRTQFGRRRSISRPRIFRKERPRFRERCAFRSSRKDQW